MLLGDTMHRLLKQHHPRVHVEAKVKFLHPNCNYPSTSLVIHNQPTGETDDSQENSQPYYLLYLCIQYFYQGTKVRHSGWA